MDVHITNDVEVWCNGWDNIEQKFPSAFRKYIYGETPKGNYGLPFQLDLLNKHKLKSVFFVEPLFSSRFGSQYLSEIVSLIQNAGQEVQLHLHPEWTDEARPAILDNVSAKRQHLYMYSLQEQTQLIKVAKALLLNSGCEKVNAFRAGSFGANDNTLKALQANNIYIDSSFNATLPECHISNKGIASFEDVKEFPMTVYEDYPGHTRHLQLTACSFREIKHVLLQAKKNNYKSVVLLMHSFELLSADHSKPDPVVINRFTKLCEFLDANRNDFVTKGFNDITSKNALRKTESPIKSNSLNFGLRMAEQIYRRLRF